LPTGKRLELEMALGISQLVPVNTNVRSHSRRVGSRPAPLFANFGRHAQRPELFERTVVPRQVRGVAAVLMLGATGVVVVVVVVAVFGAPTASTKAGMAIHPAQRLAPPYATQPRVLQVQ
jgi:hypothetical protein